MDERDRIWHGLGIVADKLQIYADNVLQRRQTVVDIKRDEDGSTEAFNLILEAYRLNLMDRCARVRTFLESWDKLPASHYHRNGWVALRDLTAYVWPDVNSNIPINTIPDANQCQADEAARIIGLIRYVQQSICSIPADSTESRTREGSNTPEPSEEATNQHVIEERERQTPKLDTESVEWLAARRENEKKLGLPIETLRNYRAASKGGRKMPDEMFGVDRDGRRWRRKGTPKSMVYYFVPSLPKR